MTHRFRVIATVESQFVADVEAENAGDAATQLGDRIRAGTIEPTVGPAIAHVEAIRYRTAEEQ